MNSDLTAGYYSEYYSLRDKYWREQSEIVEKMLEVGVGKYFKNIPDIDKAFKSEDKCLRCIDEGTCGGIHVAGSGILLGEGKMLEYLKSGDIDGIYSHEDCGAAALYVKNYNLDASQAENYAVDWAIKLAQKLNIPYKGHILINEMKRPKGLHVARVLYYDATGSFDSAKVSQLPRGFTVSRKFLNAADALEEALLAFKIASGEHGFGEKISQNHPFVIIPIASSGDPQFSLENLTNELKEITENGKGKVVVDGFAPDEYD